MDHPLFTPVARAFRHADENKFGNASETRFGKTESFIFKLVLENSIQNRTSTMILVGFDALASALVIVSILYDAWKWSKKSSLLDSERRYLFLRMIHPAEHVPLIFSSAAIAQALIFLAVQGMGLQSLWVSNCKAIAQVVFPSVWIVAYTLLVFGAETAYRGLQKDRFAPRGRWNTPICFAVIMFMVLLTWIPTAVREVKSDKCLGSLILFTAFWSDVAFGIGFSLIILYVAIGAIVTIQLFRTVKLERDERIAASRVVYYLVVGVLIFIFVVPFWARIIFAHRSGVTGMMATIALNLFGFNFFLLHLLLRSNADNTAIRPVNIPWRRNLGWRFFGSPDLDIGQHITTPVRLERNSLVGMYGNAKEKLNYAEYEASGAAGTVEHGATINATSMFDTHKSLPPHPLRKPTPSIARHSRKKSNYSVFPTRESARQARRQSSMYDTNDENLLVPPVAPFARPHQRHSSGISSATVQIGLRLSNVGAPPVMGFSNPYLSGLSPTQTNNPWQPFGLQDTTREVSQQSFDIPVALKSPREIGPFVPPPPNEPRSESRYSERSDSGLKKVIDRSAMMKVLPPPPPLSFHARESVPPGSGLQRLSEVRSQETSPQQGSWPLEESLAMLPKKTYQPGNEWI